MNKPLARCALCVDTAGLINVPPGWTFVEVPVAGIQAAPRADCVIVSAVLDAVAMADVRRLHLPVIALFDSSGPIDPAQLDSCDAYLFADDDADTVDRLLEEATALSQSYSVRDMSDVAARTIGALSADAARIAQALESLAARAVPGQPEPVTAASVRRLIKQRRDRDKFLPAMLFADPAWDMLLDLTAARLESVDVPVSSLCIAAAVPTTTALRWIRTLTEAGLFQRRNDPGDARRNFVTLTDRAAQAMFDWLRQFSAQWQAG